MHQLGAIGANLGAVACFFDHPWSRLSSNLSAAFQGWLLNEAALYLRSLGRLTEAAEPMRAALETVVGQEDWTNAAASAGNLSELELTLGAVSAAIDRAGQSVTLADRSGDAFQRLVKRATCADALHQGGHRDEARRLFTEAEGLQAKDQPTYPRLYSLPGIRYCDLLLSGAERAAWQATLSGTGFQSVSADVHGQEDHVAACDHVVQRATETIKLACEENWLLDIALDHLTLGRTALYRALLSQSKMPVQKSEIQFHLAAAVDGLRESGTTHELPRSLLTRAWHRALTDNATGATADLDEAWEIAERGPMPLYQVDVLLSRARLFRIRNSEGGIRKEQGAYPWGSAEEDLAEARRLIEKHGYHRRDEELADAEAAILRSG